MREMLCSRHHELIRRYSLGLLDDADALRAEEISHECSECSSWLDQEFSGAAFDVVQQGVSDALATVTLQAHDQKQGWHRQGRQNRRWAPLAAMAAAAMLILVGGLQWHEHRSIDRTSQQVNAPNTIARFDFESLSSQMPRIVQKEEPRSPELVTNTKQAPQKESPSPLFSDGAEDGSLKAWSIHT